MISDKEYKKLLKQFHKLSDRHILVVVAARPMTRGDYNIFRGWQIPADEDPADEGYVMKYENGHVQWLPKDMFESDYKEYDESTLPATAIGMVSSDYKECFQAEYKQLRIRYEKLKRMRQ